MVVTRLDYLFLRVDRDGMTQEELVISPDDFKECNYLLQTTSNILSSLSHNGWAALLTHSLSRVEKYNDDSVSKGELSL